MTPEQQRQCQIYTEILVDSNFERLVEEAFLLYEDLYDFNFGEPIGFPPLYNI